MFRSSPRAGNLGAPRAKDFGRANRGRRHRQVELDAHAGHVQDPLSGAMLRRAR
jgi:hypothetical protein